MSIRGNGDRYVVMLSGTGIFKAANFSVKGDSVLHAPEVNFGINFNGINFNGSLDPQHPGNYEFISNGESVAIPRYL
ncbi:MULTISPECIES: hypothetical protein [unclassified Pseudomonas]|uniref:hypothetical protein n=1 Tax=unclassified Pseudomonas TaxID=196821 RepID=UPI0011AECA77|nr:MULTISPECIES: hypothetical protein [unclassified Pseudomonas]